MTTADATRPRDDLCFLLSQASHVLLTEQTAALAELGISPRALCVLAKASGQELTQSQLAARCGLDKTTMVVTLDELERAGLAERRPSATDRRAHVVAVTRAGRGMLARGRKVIDRLNEDVLAALPAGQRRDFVAALESLVEGRLAAPVPCEKPVRRRVPRAT